MLTGFDSNHRRVALGLGVTALTIGAVSLAWTGVGGSTQSTSFTPAASNESLGDISGPCDEAENAAKPECAGTSTPDGATAPAPTDAPAGSQVDGADVRTFDAAGAGTVTYRVEGGQLTLVAASPAAGWRVEVERGSGSELDLDFRAGARRVQVDVEFEDGGVRERVRLRDDALGTEEETVNGVTTGDDRSAPVDGSAVDDRSGPSGTSDDDDPGEEGHDDDGLDDEAHDDDDEHDDDHGDDGSDDDSGEDRSGSSDDDDPDDTEDSSD